ASVWWTWTAPGDGLARISTSGSNFDTLLAVYTGSTLGSMASIASSDDAGGLDVTSAVAFDAVGGTTYQIAVDGFGGASGTIVLSLSETLAAAPANDNFGNASTLSGRTVNTTSSNVSATNESGEPNHAGNSGGA